MAIFLQPDKVENCKRKWVPAQSLQLLQCTHEDNTVMQVFIRNDGSRTRNAEQVARNYLPAVVHGRN